MSMVPVLVADPDLAATLGTAERLEAERALVAPLLAVADGPWGLPVGVGVDDRLLGALILEGHLRRCLTVAGRSATQVYGPGDVVRPWDGADVALPVPATATWQACGATRLALLDRRFVAIAARYPSVLIALARRGAAQQARSQLHAAVRQLPRVEDRILLLFLHLGEHWGRMTRDGIVLRLALTHASIAELVGTTRPPVSTAVGQLARQGLLLRLHDGWLLDRRAEEHLAAALGAPTRFAHESTNGHGPSVTLAASDNPEHRS